MSPPIVSTSTWERIAVVPDTMACRMTTPARAATSSGEADRLVTCRMSIASASVPLRFRPSSGSVPALSRWMCGCTNAVLTRRPPASSSARHSPSTRSPTQAIRPEDMAISASPSLFSIRQFRTTRSNGVPLVVMSCPCLFDPGDEIGPPGSSHLVSEPERGARHMAEQAPPWPKQGPASYFPSIEKKYGRSIAEWQQIIAGCGLEKHMDIVGYLKSEHGMGHGHANALVGWTLQGNVARP